MICLAGGLRVAVLSKPHAKLCAGADPELAVDAREVGLHGLGTQEGSRGDLLVGQTPSPGTPPTLLAEISTWNWAPLP